MARTIPGPRPTIRSLALCAAAVTTTLSGAVAPVAAAPTMDVVGASQSIQQALDGAAPGATVVVPRGVYAESLTITRPVRLVARRGVVLVPPASAPDNLCTRDPDAPDGAIPGICIAGQVTDPDAQAPPVTVPVDDVTVQGLTVRGFGFAAIEAYGARHLVLDHLTATRDASGGVFVAKSRGVRIDHLDVHDTAGRGLDLHEGNSGLLVRDSAFVGNAGDGIFVGDGTRIRIERNRISDNCAGIAAVDLAVAGQHGLSHLTVRDNTVTHNNRFCPGGGPAVPSESGTGIALVGAAHSLVARNSVRHNAGGVDPGTGRPADVSLGGIALVDAGPLTGGAAPHDNLVRSNIARHNRPFDLLYDGSGSGNRLVRNTCGSTTVPGVCTRHHRGSHR